MIPESRKDDGLIFLRSVIENASLSRLPFFATLGVVQRRRERATARLMLEECEVRGASYAAPVTTLSGGNQQKVLFAKWLFRPPRVFIADEPTRGIDVGAKRAIYELIHSLAAQGIGVLLISSEHEEILGLAHRVLVMRNGRIVAELDRQTMNEDALLHAAFATTGTKVA